MSEYNVNAADPRLISFLNNNSNILNMLFNQSAVNHRINTIIHIDDILNHYNLETFIEYVLTQCKDSYIFEELHIALAKKFPTYFIDHNAISNYQGRTAGYDITHDICIAISNLYKEDYSPHNLLYLSFLKNMHCVETILQRIQADSTNIYEYGNMINTILHNMTALKHFECVEHFHDILYLSPSQLFLLDIYNQVPYDIVQNPDFYIEALQYAHEIYERDNKIVHLRNVTANIIQHYGQYFIDNNAQQVLTADQKTIICHNIATMIRNRYYNDKDSIKRVSLFSQDVISIFLKIMQYIDVPNQDDMKAATYQMQKVLLPLLQEMMFGTISTHPPVVVHTPHITENIIEIYEKYEDIIPINSIFMISCITQRYDIAEHFIELSVNTQNEMMQIKQAFLHTGNDNSKIAKTILSLFQNNCNSQVAKILLSSNIIQEHYVGHICGLAILRNMLDVVKYANHLSNNQEIPQDILNKIFSNIVTLKCFSQSIVYDLVYKQSVESLLHAIGYALQNPHQDHIYEKHKQEMIKYIMSYIIYMTDSLDDLKGIAEPHLHAMLDDVATHINHHTTRDELESAKNNQLICKNQLFRNVPFRTTDMLSEAKKLINNIQPDRINQSAEIIEQDVASFFSYSVLQQEKFISYHNSLSAALSYTTAATISIHKFFTNMQSQQELDLEDITNVVFFHKNFFNYKSLVDIFTYMPELLVQSGILQELVRYAYLHYDCDDNFRHNIQWPRNAMIDRIVDNEGIPETREEYEERMDIAWKDFCFTSQWAFTHMMYNIFARQLLIKNGGLDKISDDEDAICYIPKTTCDRVINTLSQYVNKNTLSKDDIANISAEFPLISCVDDEYILPPKTMGSYIVENADYLLL